MKFKTLCMFFGGYLGYLSASHFGFLSSNFSFFIIGRLCAVWLIMIGAMIGLGIGAVLDEED